MGGCGGNCSGCSGCAKELVLSQQEIRWLVTLGQIPFLPVARKMGDLTPVYPEQTENTPEENSLLLQLLEKKGLISLDYDKPLQGFHGDDYDAYPVRGSMALTERGQLVLELLERQGFQEA